MVQMFLLLAASKTLRMLRATGRAISKNHGFDLSAYSLCMSMMRRAGFFPNPVLPFPNLEKVLYSWLRSKVGSLRVSRHQPLARLRCLITARAATTITTRTPTNMASSVVPNVNALEVVSVVVVPVIVEAMKTLANEF